jgi:hypothetical protein
MEDMSAVASGHPESPPRFFQRIRSTGGNAEHSRRSRRMPPMTAVAENLTDSEQNGAAGSGSVSRRSRRAIFRRLYVSSWPGAAGRRGPAFALQRSKSRMSGPERRWSDDRVAFSHRQQVFVTGDGVVSARCLEYGEQFAQERPDHRSRASLVPGLAAVR